MDAVHIYAPACGSIRIIRKHSFSLLGQALFGAERYQEAATLWREPRSSTRAIHRICPARRHLRYSRSRGRSQRAIARFNKLWVERGDVPLTVSSNSLFRLLTGRPTETASSRDTDSLECPNHLPSEICQQNLLTADEVQSLFLGHRLRGRSLWTGQERSASVTEDGRATVSGDWGNFTGGKIDFKDNQVCFYRNYCGSVYRNPGGPKKQENEYIWYDHRMAYTFSQIE